MSSPLSLDDLKRGAEASIVVVFVDDNHFQAVIPSKLPCEIWICNKIQGSPILTVDLDDVEWPTLGTSFKRTNHENKQPFKVCKTTNGGQRKRKSRVIYSSEEDATVISARSTTIVSDAEDCMGYIVDPENQFEAEKSSLQTNRDLESRTACTSFGINNNGKSIPNFILCH